MFWFTVLTGSPRQERQGTSIDLLLGEPLTTVSPTLPHATLSPSPLTTHPSVVSPSPPPYSTPQTKVAHKAYTTYQEKLRPNFTSSPPSHGHSDSRENLILPNATSSAAGYTEPQLPGSRPVGGDVESGRGRQAHAEEEPPRTPGWRFGGFGFGKMADKKGGGVGGLVISKPLESLPSEFATEWDGEGEVVLMLFAWDLIEYAPSLPFNTPRGRI